MSIARLKKLKEKGSLSVPDIRLYQLASQLRYITDWIQSDNESIYTYPCRLIIPYVVFYLHPSQKDLESWWQHDYNATIKAWRDIRKLDGFEGQLTSLSPVCGSIDFCPGATDRGFELWRCKGIPTVGHLYEKNVMLSLSQVCKKYSLSKKEFFRCLQMRNFLNSQKDTGLCYQLSKLEMIITSKEYI